MKKTTLITIALIVLTGCIDNIKPDLSAKLSCDLEEYCAESEGSPFKAIFKAALKTQIRGSLPDLCKKHYEAYGFDFRAPLSERCYDEK